MLKAIVLIAAGMFASVALADADEDCDEDEDCEVVEVIGQVHNQPGIYFYNEQMYGGTGIIYLAPEFEATMKEKCTNAVDAAKNAGAIPAAAATVAFGAIMGVHYTCKAVKVGTPKKVCQALIAAAAAACTAAGV